MELIGRRSETEELASCLTSNKPEFVAIYGRRRVGKTFLVRETFRERFAFYLTGSAKADTKTQLENFAAALREHGGNEQAVPGDWFEAFRMLKEYLAGSTGAGKKIIFLDEMPWLDTHKSRFVSALEYFWNSWASDRQDILLVVCGSAASWMVSKVFRDRGGLHNRVTRRIRLEPFTLAECEAYYASKGIVMNRREQLESYMIFGGIPFYLSLLDKRFGLAQNVGRLCFSGNGILRDEFFSLYDSLFLHSEKHIAIVETLSRKNKGLARQEIVRIAGIANGGGLTRVLHELEQSGFIRSYKPFSRKERGTLYQLVDFFTLFYFNFIRKSPPDDADYWLKHLAGGGHNAWAGNSFEQVCQYHLRQILRKLGISGIIVYASSWRSEKSDPGAQIDLVLDRGDNVVNLCEMKYASEEYVITKSDDKNLRNKRAAFLAETKTRKAVHLTMVTTYGVVRNEYAGNIQSEITAEDLFREEW
ncbi:MAG: AAA family ATPase [Clostridiales Family XIII bacterium]|jgi:AAA+ ATPase superfamily predicted ATPase|nr:AAA family ATPase [Clostridiales Family XIII bacterium]